MGDRFNTDWWSHMLYRKKKMELQWGDKTFMVCLEHIPSCIRLCSLDVERSEKGRRAFCCSLQRAWRQKLAASKLQWGRWQCKLLNCGRVKNCRRKNKVWDSGLCLPSSRFLCWHLMAAALEGEKEFSTSPHHCENVDVIDYWSCDTLPLTHLIIPATNFLMY